MAENLYTDKKSALEEWAAQKYDAFFTKMDVTSIKTIDLAKEIAKEIFNAENLAKFDSYTLTSILTQKIPNSFLTIPAFVLEMFHFAYASWGPLAETDINVAQRIADLVQWDSEMIPQELKFDMCLDISKLYFNLNNLTYGDLWLSKTRERKRGLDLDAKKSLQYDWAHSRYFLATRNFARSGKSYYLLCQFQKQAAEVLPDQTQLERDSFFRECFDLAVNCGIMADYGEQKDTILMELMKDNRIKGTKNYPVLLKMSQGIFLSNEERDSFSKSLNAELHMVIASKYGMTNLELVFLEHNVLSCSRLYRDMKLDGLAQKLKVKKDILERYLHDMNSEGKLAIDIDHRAGLITFKKGNLKARENRLALERFCVLLESINAAYKVKTR